VLEQLASLLTNFESEFQGLIQKHEENVTALYEDQGLMEEIYEDYKSLYLEPKRVILAGLSQQIQEEDIPFVDKELDFIASR
jgi:hypothetical protein